MAASANTSNTYFANYDRRTLVLYIALVLVGWLMIYTVNYDAKDPFNFLLLKSESGKQLVFIIVNFVLLFVIMLTDWSLWRTFSFPIYIFSLVILPGTLIFGREINGAYAWYQFGGFSLQPAELTKFGTCLAMAGYLSSTNSNLRDLRNRAIAMGIFLLPVLMVLLQNDTGSALVFFSFMLVLFREGLSPNWYILGFSTAGLVILGLIYPPPYVGAYLMLLFSGVLITRFKEKRNLWWGILALSTVLVVAWESLIKLLREEVKIQFGPLDAYTDQLVLIPSVALLLATFMPSYRKKNSLIQGRLQIWALLLVAGCTLVYLSNFAVYNVLAPHQQKRITIWLKPEVAAAEMRGAAYNGEHAKMAIGSGGFSGKGWLEGNMTKLRYVPKQSTDFIFCTIGEEQGFIGTAGLITIFLLLLYRITVLAERQRSNFSRIYAYGVAGVIFVHFMINTGMTMGLFPIIGIPLPFISYGGSSLLGFTLMIGVLLKLDSNRNLA